MKGMKKLLSILMVLTLVLSLGASAFAAEITIAQRDPDNPHTYKGYQIFSGTQDDTKDDDAPLGDVTWGSGIKGSEFLDALKASTDPAFVVEGANVFAACEDAKDVAEALGKFDDDSAAAEAFAKLAQNYINEEAGVDIVAGNPTTVDDGYYLIVDTTNVTGKNDAKNHTMLQVTDKIDVTIKYDVPSSEKKVIDINDTTDEIPYTIKPGPTNEEYWKDSADHDLGDDIWFKLSGTLPTDLEDYRELGYTLTFHDKEDAGLNFNADSVSVYYVSPDGNSKVELKKGFEVKVDPGHEDTFDVVFPNVFKVDYGEVAPGGKIVVVYSAKLEGANVKYGTEGNWNEMSMEYSNNSREEGTGRTPADKVVVFTYTLKTDKTGPDGETPLEGAGFTLLKKYLQPDTNASYADAPEYNYKNVQDAAVDTWLVEKDARDNITAYWKVVGVLEGVEDMTTFKFDGVDDGTYRLVETIVPDGFNKADDMEFTIKGTHTNDPDTLELQVLEANGKIVDANKAIDVGVNKATGEVSTTVINNEGATLPETGGIGTTIFYIAGAILVAGAVILLVTKKRVSGMEK